MKLKTLHPKYPILKVCFFIESNNIVLFGFSSKVANCKKCMSVPFNVYH